MKLAIIFSFLSLQVFAQKVETITPAQPVVTGTAFLVQYVITEPSLLANIISPEFQDLQIVSGPNHYKGNAVVDGRAQAIENVTYTLVASRKGSIKIPGLTAIFKTGLKFTSTAENLEVVMPPQASYLSSSAYTDASLYNPASKTDIEKLVEQNIFIKTDISKQKVFVGEPVVATFTLYSRLQAVSEVVNTPSLYGFRAIDMLDINRSYQSVKTIGNKIFNTSVIRKLQLYPEQPGKLVVDEMQIRNEIEFDDPLLSNHKKKVEKLLNSTPGFVTVKELPANKPLNFSGAVGNFSIEGSIKQDALAVNQQGRLVIRIKGKGNFSQFSIPVVDWPKGFDVFEPRINEQIDKTIAPMAGSTEYIFNFVHDSIGKFLIPSVVFSFFDPAAGKYKTIQTDPIALEISPVTSVSISEQINKPKSSKLLIWTLLPLILIGVFLFYWIRKRRPPKTVTPVADSTRAAIMDQLSRLDMQKLTPKQSCMELQKFIRRISSERSLTVEQKKELESIEKDCQLLAYSDINESFDKEELKRRLLGVLEG